MKARLLAVLCVVSCGPSKPPAPPSVDVSTAMKNDLAFAIYPLSGASMYGTAYRDHYPEFWTRFGPAMPSSVKPALEAMRAMKDQQGFLVGSSLARLYNRLDAQTIDGLVKALEADDPAVLAEVNSWGPGLLDLYTTGGFKPALLGILSSLEGAGFESWWAQAVKPRLDSTADAWRASGLDAIAIKPEVARWAGHPAREGVIHVCPVYLMMFQGQQLLFADRPGLTYLADSAWSADDVALQLVHEVAHNQLLDWADPAVRAASATLGRDAYFANVFEHQKVVSGYVLLDDFVEENVTEGVQMLMAADLGLSVNPRSYLRAHENGSHVLSAAMLQRLRETGWAPGTEPFQAWFLRQVADGSLGPGTIETLHDRYFAMP